MNAIRTALVRLVLTGLFLALITPGLVGCGGGSGDGQPDPSGPQGIRFAVDSAYTQMIYSADVTGPAGKEKHLLGLSPGQEMFIALPTGDYSIQFWIHAGGGISVIDHTLRYTRVEPSQVTQVMYP